MISQPSILNRTHRSMSADSRSVDFVPDEVWQRIAIEAGPRATLVMSCVSTGMREAVKDVRAVVLGVARDRLEVVAQDAAIDRARCKRAYFLQRRQDTLFLFEQVPLVGPLIGLRLVESGSSSARRLTRSLSWQVAILPLSIVALPLMGAALTYGLKGLYQHRKIYLARKAAVEQCLEVHRHHLFSHGIDEDPRWRLATEQRFVAQSERAPADSRRAPRHASI